MENPDQDLLLLQPVSRTQSTGASSESEQEQKDESEPNTPEPKLGPPTLALIEFRIQQLHNRRFILLEMQRFIKKEEDISAVTAEEMTCEDSDELCELDTIQKELKELLVKKETLEKHGNGSSLSRNNGQQDSTFYKTETPYGGIYMLPPPELTQEDITLDPEITTRPAAERPTGPVIPVDGLGQTSAVTKCPSCDEVVNTETHKKVGESVWTVCCLCATLGCVAGCCLVPFFMDRLKTVQHRCPHCHAHIHDYQPF